jgi:hypothetical protein
MDGRRSFVRTSAALSVVSKLPFSATKQYIIVIIIIIIIIIINICTEEITGTRTVQLFSLRVYRLGKGGGSQARILETLLPDWGHYTVHCENIECYMEY